MCCIFVCSIGVSSMFSITISVLGRPFALGVGFGGLGGGWCTPHVFSCVCLNVFTVMNLPQIGHSCNSLVLTFVFGTST